MIKNRFTFDASPQNVGLFLCIDIGANRIGVFKINARVYPQTLYVPMTNFVYFFAAARLEFVICGFNIIVEAQINIPVFGKPFAAQRIFNPEVDIYRIQSFPRVRQADGIFFVNAVLVSFQRALLFGIVSFTA